jgi:hypothetical protein
VLSVTVWSRGDGILRLDDARHQGRANTCADCYCDARAPPIGTEAFTGVIDMPESTGQTDQADQTRESTQSSRAGPLLFIVTFVAAAALIVGVVAFFWSQTYNSPSGLEIAKPIGTASVDGVSMPHVTLYLQTYPDASGTIPSGLPHSGALIHPGGNPTWPAYGPTNQFQVPAHALVTVSVRQYDSGGSLNDPWFATVRGTVGNVAIINGKTVHGINPNNVGHTFTVRGAPGVDPNFFVSVPLPLANTNNNLDSGPYCESQQYLGEKTSVRQNNPCYNTIQFSFISGSKGVYAWNCEFPCGVSLAGFGGPMSTYGYMSGFLHVV